MRFGKISYLNLLPFDVFIKKYPTISTFKLFLNKKKSYPARLNKDFLMKRIDAGFISSIAAYTYAKGFCCAKKRCETKAGIIARGDVWSVIVLPNTPKEDYQSASSNALCQVLGLSGEVLIGDRALHYKLLNKPHIDMGKEWWEKHGLGFCFGRLCFNTHGDFYTRIANAFIKTRIKIPYYILQEKAKDTHIATKDILAYLKRIHYCVGKKEHLAMSRFYAKMRIKRVKKPSRF